MKNTIRTFSNEIYRLQQITEIQKEYKSKKFVFVKSSIMYEILLFLGASDEDMNKLQYISNNLETDPTLLFRKSRNGRFCFDLNKQKLQRLEF